MNKVEELISDIRNGKMVILVDDEDRENEGDLVLAADFVTPESINFMTHHARGLICLSLESKQIDKLQIPMMVRDELNFSSHKTAFTVSIEASRDVGTGISAYDRAQTIRVASNPNVKPQDIVCPGHIFPIKAQEGGVLKRAGHTEASVDLAKLAGLNGAAVICEIMNPDGSMARMKDLKLFAKKHNIKIGSIANLISYRLQTETLVEEVASSRLPVDSGATYNVRVFKNTLDNTEHVVLQMGSWKKGDDVLIRVHSECMTGDIFGSLRCDCGPQLKKAMKIIEENGCGAIIYLKQEGRGIGLTNKIMCYSVQDEKGLDTVEANLHLGFKPDHRDYGIGAQILRSIGAVRLKLITNNPAKRVGLDGYGIEIVDRVPIEIESNPENESYLKTKKDKMGHMLDMLKNGDKPKRTH